VRVPPLAAAGSSGKSVVGAAGLDDRRPPRAAAIYPCSSCDPTRPLCWLLPAAVRHAIVMSEATT